MAHHAFEGSGSGAPLGTRETDSAAGWGQAMEACRQYLLLVADRHIGPDLLPKGAASDLVQETFLEAQRDRLRFRGSSPVELRAWLRRILLNNLANFTRRYRASGKRRVSCEVSLDAAGSGDGVRAGLVHRGSWTPVRQAIRREQVEALGAAIGQLAPRDRDLIVWHHQEQCGFDEMGRRLGISAEAARVAWARAIKRLQTLASDPKSETRP